MSELIDRSQAIEAAKNAWVEKHTGKYWEDGARDIISVFVKSLASLPVVPDTDSTAISEELVDRRRAMHQIFWLNLSPNIEAICKEVYKKWGGENGK